MKESIDPALARALQLVKAKVPQVPRAAVILGSGISAFESLIEAEEIPFLELFGKAPTTSGHGGRLRLGRLTKEDLRPLAVLEGRFHLYEGHDWQTVTLPMRLLINWGVPLVLITNAAGGLNLDYSVGDLMVIKGYRDLLNPQWRTKGLLPALKEPVKNCGNWVSDALIAQSKKADPGDASRPLRAGVFVGVMGPNYETMAEVEMLRRLGCDAVAMSTIPELEVLIGSETKAAALSVITNVWRKDVQMGGHEEVLESSKKASARLDRLFRDFLAEAG